MRKSFKNKLIKDLTNRIHELNTQLKTHPDYRSSILFELRVKTKLLDEIKNSN